MFISESTISHKIMFRIIVFLLVGFFYGECTRNYSQMLEVTNGAEWGDWRDPEFCPEGHFAIGYQMKREDGHFLPYDDTEINGLRLICAEGRSETETTIESGVGPWGIWLDPVSCNQYPRTAFYIVAFALEVAIPVHGSLADNTAVNWIKFQCRDVNPEDGINMEIEELNKHPYKGDYGGWGDYSHQCHEGSAVCGLSTKILEPATSDDETALNDVRLYCCEIHEDIINLISIIG